MSAALFFISGLLLGAGSTLFVCVRSLRGAVDDAREAGRIDGILASDRARRPK